METVIQDRTPLADYLRDEGDEQQTERWSTPIMSKRYDGSPSPTRSFAPVGRPTVRRRFGSKVPDPLRLHIPPRSHLGSLHDTYTRAVASTIDRADNHKFIEQFRYTIVASQLLNGHSIARHVRNPSEGTVSGANRTVAPTSTGLVIIAVGALAVACMLRWFYSGGYSHLSKRRFVCALAVLAAAASVAHVYIRQQWLRCLRDQTLAQVTDLISSSQHLDNAVGAALSLIQEVELVSRGYRLSAPLPPISRIEDRGQKRRCVRLRKVLKDRFSEMIARYDEIVSVVKAFSEQSDLEKYCDIYDISDLDISDVQQGFSESDLDDAQSLRTLKIAAARFHTIRKIFLCALLALEATGDNKDFMRWSAVVEGLRALNKTNRESHERFHTILIEEETFPTTADARMPLSPNRERWRSQLRKLNSLTTGIRGLQAKLILLREESDRTLNEAEDISELGPSLMAQYESIGQDVRMLTQAWEEGRAALASGIDRNEKRLSSLCTLVSPAPSLSGLTTVGEGGTLDAFKALTGESPPSSSFGSPDPDPEEPEVFEAIAIPRPRSILSREERLLRMREDRERKEVSRERVDASKGMLRELEMVINLRPKPSNPSPVTIRPVSGPVSL